MCMSYIIFSLILDEKLAKKIIVILEAEAQFYRLNILTSSCRVALYCSIFVFRIVLELEVLVIRHAYWLPVLGKTLYTNE